MSNFAAWWALCQQPNNDGRADDAADDGAGPTRWGWTYPTWGDARRYAGLPYPTLAFDSMTQAQAGTLALVYFWNRLGGRRLNSGSDVSLIDWAWTSGGAVEEIQHHLGIDNDGIVGPQTIVTVNSAGPEFVARCREWRVSYYNMLGFQTEFPGLYRRAADVLALARKLQGVV